MASEKARLQQDAMVFVQELPTMTVEDAMIKAATIDPRNIDYSYWPEIFAADNWITQFWLSHPKFWVPLEYLMMMPLHMNDSFRIAFKKAEYSESTIKNAIRNVDEVFPECVSAQDNDYADERFDFLMRQRYSKNS